MAVAVVVVVVVARENGRARDPRIINIDHRSAIDQRSALGKGLEGARGSGLVAQAVYSIFASHWHAVLCTHNGWR